MVISKTGPTIQTTIRLSPECHERLESLPGKTLSAKIRKAIELAVAPAATPADSDAVRADNAGVEFSEQSSE